jgi:hypothetical protein
MRRSRDRVIQPSFQSTLPRANRYYTRVSVEVIFYDQIIRIKWFSDLQLAYMWCIEQKNLHSEEEWEPVKSFPEFATMMDTRWACVQSRCECTLLRSESYVYKLWYELNDEVD